MYILKIIIWPMNNNFSPRLINFEVGRLNVIRGHSRTGKTALISIADYVLGASKCRIPVGIIRDKVSWYGLLLKNPKGTEILIARKKPENQKSSSLMYFEMGKEISIPETIEKENMNLLQLKEKLNNFLGYSDIKLDEENPFAKKPSYRDSISLNFQPQTIIANPNTLFYKSDSNEHREKMKWFLPYVLEIRTNQNLLDSYEIQELEKENRKLAKENEDFEKQLENYNNRLDIQISKGLSFGLIDNKRVNSVTSIVNKVDILRDIYAEVNILLTTDRLKEYNKIIKKRDMRLQYLHRNILNLNYQCDIIEKQLNSSLQDNLNIKNNIDSRISLTEWLISETDKFSDVVVADEVISTINQYKDVNENISYAINVLKKELINKKSILKSYLKEFKELEQVVRTYYQNISDDEKTLSQEIFEFKGYLKHEINFFDSIENNELVDQITKNKYRIDLLKQKNNEDKIKEKERKTLNHITDKTRESLMTLDVDDKYAPVTLELQELTISREKMNTENYQDKEYLWEIGSASNWLSYHISTYLAIHGYLNEIKSSKIFNFIIFDQPSQVYFPSDTAPEKNDKDLENVKKVFSTCNMFLQKNKNYQIIILEHASEQLWDGISNASIQEVWDDITKIKLIPEEW